MSVTEHRHFRVGIDTGGTFTDVVAIGDHGEVLTTKTPTTSEDPSRGLVEGVRKVLRGTSGRPVGIYHGTTVATNALLEERFTSLGLITTRGFRHVLEIARQSVPSGYGNSYFWVKPDRIVPLHHVQEVTERLNFRGQVVTEFDAEEARCVARWFRDQGIASIAVCFLHAYANGRHEQLMQQILREEHPHASVSVSSEVLPEYREYERTVTTVVDAFVKPSVRDYVEHAETRVHTFEDQGERLPFLIMQSNGGVLSAHQVAQKPITTLLSGPAAGALGASWLAGLAGFSSVLTVDAGGTSTDICVVDDGKPHVTSEGKVGRFPVKVPMIDISTIGTGGGSIAWLDPSNSLRVGPKSAGAVPGPMCYGQGGQYPTLTDANLLLGRLPPHLLGGEVPLDVDRSRFGLDQLAHALGLETTHLAAGILEIADWSQVNAIRQITVKKGLDPRDYVMVPFGGSGPLQAARVAHLLDLDTVLIPANPGNVSALGLLTVDLRSEFVTTSVHREDELDAGEIVAAFSRLEETANQDLTVQGVPSERRRFLRSADMRYFGQAYEMRVDLPGGPLNLATLTEAIQSFHDAHERFYGYCYRGTQRVEIVNVRITGIGLIDSPHIEAAPTTDHVSGEPSGTRPVFFASKFIDCPIYTRDRLQPGNYFDGPAVVEEYGSTTIVQAEQRVEVDSYRNLLIRPVARS